MAQSVTVNSASVLSGVPQNPANTQAADGVAGLVNMGHQQEMLVAELGDRHRLMAARGKVFWGASTTAAISIPVNTTTSAHTFLLNNPTGSGVNAELIYTQLDLLITNAFAATALIIGWSVFNNVSNVLSSLTSIPGPIRAGGNPTNFGGSIPSCTLYSAATTGSALTVAANWGFPLWSFPASFNPTAAITPPVLRRDHLGSIILPPGFGLSLVASTATGSNTAVPSVMWAEYLQ
jgi:hypothetical protein